MIAVRECLLAVAVFALWTACCTGARAAENIPAHSMLLWLRADQPGDHVFKVKVGDVVYEKGWAVGGDARKIPVKRLRGWEAVLYPGEAAIPSGAPILSLELDMHTRPLDFVWDGELGILMWAMVLSLLAGVALKDFFGVTL